MSCRNIVLLILLVLSSIMAACMLVIYYYGIKGAIGVLVFIAVLYFCGKGLVKQLFLLPFRAKGSVLKNPKTSLNAVTFLGEVEGNDRGEPDATKKEYNKFAIDIEIFPQLRPGKKFTMWDPSEIMVVKYGAKVSTSSDPTSSDDSAGTLKEFKVWDGNQWEEFTGDKIQGGRRIQLIFDIEQGVDRVELQYYFYKFSDIKLPMSNQ